MGINYLAVGLAALAAFFLGFLWYTILFAKEWQRLIGIGTAGTGAKSAAQTPNLGRLLAGSFVLELIMAFFLAVFMDTEAILLAVEATWYFGFAIGLAVGVGFVGLAFGVNYMFEGKPLKLWLINAGYNALVFAVMGAIIGAF